MAQGGVLYNGLAILSGGAIVTGLLWGSMVVFLIDRKPQAAGTVAILSAALTFFGFIHSSTVQVMASPMMALSYVIVAALFYWFATMEISEKEPEVEPAE